MDYSQILQAMLVYIDQHLTDELDVQTLAGVAGFSPYHFCRVFEFAVGYPVMLYVRQRRLAFAATQLSTQRSILDIAMEYGFETHSGFSKAFRRVFGCSPDAYRRHGHFEPPQLPSLDILNQYRTGGIIMEPKFVTLPATRLVGYTIESRNTDGSNSVDIPAFWSAYISDGRMKQLHSQPFIKSHDEFGACFPSFGNNGSFTYMIGVALPDGTPDPEGFTVMEMPAATYAVFTTPPAAASEFAANIQGTWQYIYNEWFAKSGYEMEEGKVDFEYYDDRGMVETGKVCDIYIPVVKRR